MARTAKHSRDRALRKARPHAPAGAAASRRRGGRPGARAKRSAERRDAILAAALDEFAARGFAAARLDDVAARAGVAKGTIYLYFRDKESAVPGAGAHRSSARWSARWSTLRARRHAARAS